MSTPNSLFLNIKKQLASKKISIYEAVDEVQKHLELFPFVEKEILSGKTPFSRLFAAWCLGKFQLSSGKTVLETAYFQEKNNNVRTNIVWAYLRLNNKDKEIYSRFAYDKYFLIRLVFLKHVNSKDQIAGKLLINSFIQSDEHPLVRIEAIKKAHVFGDKVSDLQDILRQILINSENLIEIEASLYSIGKLMNSNSLQILMTFFKVREKLLFENQFIALGFCHAISDLNESQAFNLLNHLYVNTSDEIVKYAALEALGLGGGPNSLNILEQIYQEEPDVTIKQHIKTLILNTEVTVV